MAQFIRLTQVRADGSTRKDTLVNVSHIATLSEMEKPPTPHPACWLFTRGGTLQNKGIAVVGSIEDISDAIAADCIVAHLSLNDRGAANT